jgi:hypothetical protein
MCNAWNHSPGCTCGWGGDGHLGRSDGYSSPFHASSGMYYFSDRTTFTSSSYASFVNPNAHCPVCHAPVFFYQSPYGGRVFFDELGPPWPKHPCTDTSYFNNGMPIQQLFDRSSSPSYPWQIDGWKPLDCINACIPMKGKTRIQAHILSHYNSYHSRYRRQYWFYISGEHEYLKHQPLLIRPIPETSFEYEIATFQLDNNSRECVSTIFPATLPSDYHRHIVQEFLD